ncbi:HD-GYP domain-containing protein [Anaeromusa acidaminophila]|uniref:HD-GYP domain-containing protein n=1 Tax=Anaeromusa acidaminophila TaxID=81464 RepID=UPI00037FF758|nr:HD domain-containing phosphohydrolase [Anaeromusa acidaminophila]
MERKADIMIVDDTPENLKLLSLLLREQGHRVRALPSGKMALAAMRKQRPEILLLDITMPEMDGYAVCEAMREEGLLADVAVIFVSALAETFDKVKAFRCGGVDYVTKPYQAEELQARLETHLSLKRLREEVQRHNQDLQQQVKAQLDELHHAQMATILAMVKLAEARDDDTGKHVERIRTFSAMLAAEVQRRGGGREIDDAFVENIYNASPLHDVGKIAIRDAILLKPGRLTPEEFEEMKLHTVYGAQTLRQVRQEYPHNAFLNMGIDIAQAHHERWDGSGYPNGLRGDAIPLAARMVAVADVYDALCSKRVYKEAYPHETSLDMLRQGAGSHFEPQLIEAFLAIEAEVLARSRELREGE